MKSLEKQKSDKGSVVAAIRECTGTPQLEETFRSFGVQDTESKMELLALAMYSPEITFGSPGLTQEQKYKSLLGAFLSRIWVGNGAIFDLVSKSRG